MKKNSLIPIVVVICLCAMVACLPAQEKSVRPGINKPFENPDVAQFVERFEREGREVYEKRKAIIEACRIKPGAAVADIGAGTGLFTRMLSTKVGPRGRVYAVDISAKFIDYIEKASREAKLGNVVGVVCGADSAKLAPSSIDLAFICATYHHFEFPQKTMRSILQSLRPGGRVVVVDYQRIEGVSTDWILGHVRADKGTVVKEIRSSGFELIEEVKLLKQNYVLIFIKAGEKSGAVLNQQGYFVHHLQSRFQKGTTAINVLMPNNIAQDEYLRAMYLLPVEAGNSRKWGDPLAEIRRLDLHNKYRLVCVEPMFSQLPWYADHPSERQCRQESYLIQEVLPLIEKNYPVQGSSKGRLLLGFSKSGWGAYSLLLRHADLFAAAAAWDAPLAMVSPGRYGSQEIFSTQENFDRYRIDHLLAQCAEDFHGSARLALLGYGNFREHHQTIHAKMNKLGIAHLYRDGPQREHAWNSGWLPEAVAFLASTK